MEVTAASVGLCYHTFCLCRVQLLLYFWNVSSSIHYYSIHVYLFSSCLNFDSREKAQPLLGTSHASMLQAVSTGVLVARQWPVPDEMGHSWFVKSKFRLVTVLTYLIKNDPVSVRSPYLAFDPSYTGECLYGAHTWLLILVILGTPLMNSHKVKNALITVSSLERLGEATCMCV